MAREGTCVHFRGIQRPCAVGIDPRTVRDDSGSGPYRWPCMGPHNALGREPCRTSCAAFVAVTAEDEARFMREVDTAIAAIDGGHCPQCAAELSEHDTGETRVWACPEHGAVMRACRGDEVSRG